MSTSSTAGSSPEFIKGVHGIRYQVRDMARSVAFYTSPRICAGASAPSGVRQCLPAQRADATQRTRSLRVASHAGRPATGARRMEPCRTPRGRSAGMHRVFEARGRALPKRDGTRTGRQADPGGGSGRKPHRALRAGTVTCDDRCDPTASMAPEHRSPLSLTYQTHRRGQAGANAITPRRAVV